MASLETLLRCLPIILSLFVTLNLSEAREFVVGGNKKKWEVPSSSDEFNKWAGKIRFQIGDSIGNVNATGMQAPPPPGQGQPVIKAAGAAAPTMGSEGAYQGPPRMSGATQHNTEVLHQRSKMPFCPARMAIGGFACVAIIGYFTLYSKKKPEATALDVAKVATGTASPENTRPRN